MSLPIRARLTVWYAAVLAVIVVALGAFVVVRLRSDLQAAVDRDVRRAAAKIARGYAASGPTSSLDVGGDRAAQRRARAAQVLDADGRVLLAYGDGVSARQMVAAGVRAARRGGPAAAPHGRAWGDFGQRFRVMALPVRRLGRRQVVVAAESLAGVERSVHRVLVLLLFAGPAALCSRPRSAAGGWRARRCARSSG